jgi:hypothetical protein
MKIKFCRSCKKKSFYNILSLGNQFYTGFFLKKNQKVPKGELNLILCKNCSLVQLDRNFNINKLYGLNYGYRTSLNKLMQNHIESKKIYVSKFVNLKKKDLIVDIGSNDGTLLNFFNSKYKLVGIDPTIKKFKKFYKKNINQVPSFFSNNSIKKYKLDNAKIIYSMSMFYDLPDPFEFVKNIKKLLDFNGVWHFEQSYLPFMLKYNSYDTICHEHLEYYTLQSIKYILDRNNLKIIDISFNDINGGSIALTTSKNPNRKESKLVKEVLKNEKKLKLNTKFPYIKFKNRVIANKKKMNDLLKKLKKNNKIVYGYGASTKGNVFLQYNNFSSSQIKAIFDVNPDKFNRYTPGSKIKILDENSSKKLKIDYILVLPWHFKKFIIKKEKNSLMKKSKFIFPLPNVKIYKK